MNIYVFEDKCKWCESFLTEMYPIVVGKRQILISNYNKSNCRSWIINIQNSIWILFVPWDEYLALAFWLNAELTFWRFLQLKTKYDT